MLDEDMAETSVGREDERVPSGLPYPIPMEELRERARTTLNRLGQDGVLQERPLFVEFSGTPKSGKSTCIDIVTHFFRRIGYKVLAPTEGASKRTPYYLKEDLVAFNTWSASYALMHVLEGLYGSDKYHLAILDRGLFDALAWFELLSANGQVTVEDRDSVHNFLRIGTWRSVIDMVLLFKADAKTSLEREHRDKLIEEPGRAMNPTFIDKLNGAYDTVEERYSADFPLRTIDTSSSKGTDPRATAEMAVELILDKFELKVNGGES